MSRKHAKQHSRKQPVQKIVVKAAVQSREREAVEVPEETDGALPVLQDDGSTKWFVVRFKVTTPEVARYIATGPTTTRGAKNDPKNMAPKGSKMSKTGPQAGGKK